MTNLELEGLSILTPQRPPIPGDQSLLPHGRDVQKPQEAPKPTPDPSAKPIER